ncbi:YwdI family protein [Bacillus xiapuensis]|uniref:YwdI family protein n=1 Tax=Bacillus xiapuensis TaxID=2014075 RepID=UPI000C24F168|nr:YwdI family protein [Bacillus xiapuensis]
MDISHQSVLDRIEKEIRQARQAETSDAIKRHIHTMKALCEVMLEASEEGRGAAAPVPGSQVQQPTIHQGGKKLTTDDGANGESIFDF